MGHTIMHYNIHVLMTMNDNELISNLQHIYNTGYHLITDIHNRFSQDSKR